MLTLDEIKLFQNIRGKTREKIREKTREKNAQKTREKIIVAIEENNHVTTAMLAEIIGLTDKGIEYHLQKLKKSQIIERLGPDKGGYWKVNKKP